MSSGEEIVQAFDKWLVSMIDAVPELRLEFVIGELMNKFGAEEVKNTTIEVYKEWLQDREDKHKEGFESQKDYDESNE